jgi:hypothetical protein
MQVSSPKIPLSSVYLNLLQARPVGPAAPVTRVSAPAPTPSPAPAQPGGTSSPSPAGANPPKNQPRGQLVDILA